MADERTLAKQTRFSAERRTRQTPGRLGCLLLLGMIALRPFATVAQVNRTIGTLPPGGAVTITFDVTINTNFPPNTSSVANQGNLTGASFNILTDDPATGAANDPTVTVVTVAPQITCPPDITTNAFGACPQTVAFSATANAGVPPPTVTYKLSGAPLTSPYAFPVGTNTVTVTATNGTLPDATCSFTVTVLAGLGPQLSIVQSGTNVVLSWPNSFPCYTLQFTPALLSPPGANVWSNDTGVVTMSGGNNFATNSNRFYRLSF